VGGAALAVSKACFFWGVMRHAPALQSFLDRAVEAVPAVLAGYAVYSTTERSFPVLLAEPGARCQGVLLAGLREEEMLALETLQSYSGYSQRRVQVETAAGERVECLLYAQNVEPDRQDLLAWDFADWQSRFGHEHAEIARTYRDRAEARPEIAARFAQLMVRAGSRSRAQVTAPTALRHRAGAQDVEQVALREPYARFFALEEVDLRFRRFNGAMSAQITRAAFVSCDAVTVLPYDPMRDTVLLIDQFRAGPHLRGDPQPWQIEAIAGRIDAGEMPEEAARREAFEEAGLELTDLLPVAQYYPSPGAVTEYLYSYVALTALEPAAEGVFGVAGETEDIRSHVLSFDQAMALVESGEIATAPLILTLYWLAANRARLRGG
jgi:ADP-ribose pyrophosphatase